MSKIYEPAGRAREYSPLALNIYQGCTHGCKYCYVPPMMKRFNPSYEQSDCKPSLNVFELEKSAKKFEGCGKQILLSFTGDPYCGVHPETTREALEILNKYNHHVAILTKGGNRILEDIDIFKKFGDRIKIGATLTFYNEEDSKEWEPGAASPEERVSSLKKIASEGITTWASFEPVVSPSQSLRLLDEVSDFIDHVKIGKLNHHKVASTINWTRFLFDAVRICREKKMKFYIKKDLQVYNKGVYLSGEEINEDFLNI